MKRTIKTGMKLAIDIQRDLAYLQSARESNWPKNAIRSIVRSFRGKYGRGRCSYQHGLDLGRKG